MLIRCVLRTFKIHRNGDAVNGGPEKDGPIDRGD